MSPVVVALFVASLPVAAQQPGGWDSVDRHALAAPAAATRSVDALAAYLSEGLDGDSAKARAAYRWITDAIAYDTGAFFSGRYGDMSAGGVLSRRSAVCAGYSSLYAELCKRMGLSVEVVRGYAKGYGYSPGALFVDTNHDWNAVLIDGKWQLVDCTWGAGYLGESRRFVKRFTEFFFLSPPQMLILSHFPQDPQWQLLDPQWSRDQFLDAVYVYPSAYSLGITARSHPLGVFPSSGRETLVFDADSDVVATASVDGEGGKAFTQLVDGGFEVLCAFSSPGRHRVMVYAAHRAEAEDGMEAVMEYAAVVEKGLGPDAGFPTTWDNYCSRRVTLVAPFTRALPSGVEVPFDIGVPGAAKVAVISGGKWSYLAQDGERFTGAVTLTPGWVQVCAKFADGGGFEGILQYEAK